MEKTNSIMAELVRAIRRDREREKVSDWVCANTTLGGKPFSLVGHEFQRAILDDEHPDIVITKLSQVGMTECSIRSVIAFLVRNGGTKCLYNFPDLKLKQANSATRIKPIFNTDFPAKSSSEVRSNDTLQLGTSYLYVGSGSESDATSLSVDMLVLDELDLTDTSIVSLMNSRLQHSKFKFKRKLSTPTFSGSGIDSEYRASDQREYFYKCPHCNNWFVPMYDLSCVYIPNLPKETTDLVRDLTSEVVVGLDYENSYVCCPKCRKRIDLSNSDGREWVAKYPERSQNVHGYYIRPFSSNLLSLQYIGKTVADQVKRGDIRRAYNTTLGETYEDGNCRLEPKDIKRCFEDSQVPELSKDKPVFLGLDMGMTCTLTLVANNGSDFVLFEQIPQERIVERIGEILERYNVIGGCVDRMPYTPTACQIRDMSGGRIMPVVFTGNKRAAPVREVDGSISHYNVDRTACLDAIADKVRNGSVKFYGYGSLQNVIYEHFRAIARDEQPEKAAVWLKLTGEDHFIFSCAYALCANYIKNLNDSLEDLGTPNSVVLLDGLVQNELDNFDLLVYDRAKVNKPIVRRL